MTEEIEVEGGTDSSYDSVLDKIVHEGKMVKDETQESHAKDLIGELAKQVLEGTITVSNDNVAMINQRIAQIDALLTNQLNEIMHQEEFQQLESSWRGLNYLVSKTETGTMLKLRLLNANRQELQKDLEKAVEFDQSQLFKKIYEEEYGTFGGAPYSTLLFDFDFGRHPQDVAFLEKAAEVAAAAHAPIITAASPKLFDMDEFTELANPRDLAKQFESTELIKWRSFRDSEDSRYVSMALPRTLMRLPYGPETLPVEEFLYQEDVNGRDHSRYLWGNASWALMTRITDAFAQFHWCGAIRGVEGGGKVEGLPAHTFPTDEGDIALKCPTEIAITDRREMELNEQGFITLCHCKGTDYAAFFGGQTVNQPKVYDSDTANSNARLSATLPYMLAASRFAHYIKVMMRDKIGSFMTQEEISSYLNGWLGTYVLGRDDAGQRLKAQYPLRDGRIDVMEIPGKPGYYTSVVFLRPHFQLEGLSASIRLVAELPG
ncbi:type VI secretion system contractile sheath large subunit [Candidatus Venteria ishoeyi]|uniref:type VI secretion system contractile sheath large subunit n=1 Tax=Candidatus Venteria ishoeyi TaxID=1899563 RepID=UPI0025A5B848|nr:type VI secretion system contractile sheath large subunit [Candidatus Venteria ishoeyi]MDM8546837.1 type VI secretion system contractile sheath large subunit [Candidatus Venteria ishoeyi]